MDIVSAEKKLREAAKKHALYQDTIRADRHIVVGKGKRNPEYLFIVEAPGIKESQEGKPLVGKSGEIFDKWLASFSISNYAILNSVPLVPLDVNGEARPATLDEVKYFEPFVQELIDAMAPKHIIRIGSGGQLLHPMEYLKNSKDGLEEFKKFFDSLSKEPEGEKELLTEFVINQQKAENLGGTEMINPILAGLHYFAKQAKIYFKDINQVDECILGEKRCKIYTRDAHMDEDMLVYDEYFRKHPEIDLYILCKIKGGSFRYLGYVTKEIVEKTRIVQMIGQDSDKASREIRRIFAEQYHSLVDHIRIMVGKAKEEEKIIEQNYIPLHLHSEYSIGDGFGTLQYIVDNLKKKGFKGAALTDHGTFGGSWDFQKKMLEAGLKPIMGCEIYTKIEGIDRRFHSIVLVKNKIGYHNLLKLQAMAVRDFFHYKPIVPFEELLKHSEGLILTSGCLSAPVPVCLSKEQYDLADEIVLKCKAAFGDDYYFEFQPNKVQDNQVVMERLYQLALKHSIKMIIATDTHYSNKDDKKFHEAVKAINFGKDYGTAGFEDDCFYLLQENDLKNLLSERHPWMLEHLPEMMKNTIEIFDKIDFKIEAPKENDTLPKFLPNQEQRKEMLKQLCIDGLTKYTPYHYEGAIKDRLDLEINRMLSKDYENYFLIVWDLVNWAKKNDIRVGPGRGSVGASLAAYALNITDCDPIEHNLLYDRFLSEIRRDMPDVDMDFMDSRREEVYDYLKSKYGKEHCAKVVTYARFHAKGIINDVGRIFKLPFVETRKLASMVIERSGGDARASFSLQDTFEEFAEAKKFKQMYPEAAEIAVKLEGHIRHRGVHAAAMVMTERAISDYVPLGNVNGEIVTEWEKQQCEDLKLVKFDILGLKTLSVIQDTVEGIKKVDAKFELPKTYDDDVIYKEIFQTGNTAGVFQFECLSGDTLIGARPGKNRTIKNLSKRKPGFETVSMFPDGTFKKNKVLAIKESGIKKLFLIKTKSGKEIKVSEKHPFLTKNGWTECRNLKPGDKLIVAENFLEKGVSEKIVKKRKINGNYSHTKETKSILSKKQIKNWENKSYRRAQTEKIKEAMFRNQDFQKKATMTKKSQKFRNQRAAIQRKLWEDPDYARIQASLTKSGILNSSHFKDAISASNSKRSKEKHWNWKGGSSARRFPSFDLEKSFFQSFIVSRKKSLFRDNYKCQRCKMNQKESMKRFSSYLETHHIKPVRNFVFERNYDFGEINNIKNLITLCKSCHQVTEHENKKL